MTNPDFLRGPWLAVLADQYGYVFSSFDVAREETDDAEEFRVSIVRGTAAPSEDDDTLRLPGTFQSGDQIFELDGLYLDGDGDTSTSAEARFAQAQAMATGLNAAGAA
ncbi:hypothetical protein [Paractinoplanes toevensis]|uniref:Uncharacterized protein n=1 Tax=Paractinoplanes toevensis TaxID=571911 RepID=A0A919T3U4_9ACTN|nr:hypothetical protein [Actinoplanes toevensis]GIM88854.1 hypothetical protein Ato02nite_006470 [Actinoplanes toevensis]